MRFRAHSPGSVTLFFEIRRSDKIHLSGSRGVGVCISPGATTEVSDDGQGIFLNGEEVDAPIQKYIARRYGFRGEIKTTTHLPISMGFGISGAIALSTSLALAAMYGKSYYYAARIAHEAEVLHGTGLGDVASQFEGGFTVRLREGIQPYGRVDRLHYDGRVILVAFDGKIETREIIGDEEWSSKIEKLGRRAMASFRRDMRVERAIEIGREFSLSLGLVSPELNSFLRRCENSTMALLGNAAIVFGECEHLPENAKVYEVEMGGRATILR